jgi:hypothetical protein
MLYRCGYEVLCWPIESPHLQQAQTWRSKGVAFNPFVMPLAPNPRTFSTGAFTWGDPTLPSALNHFTSGRRCE